jgi:rRNA maturation RNase YbeY
VREVALSRVFPMVINRQNKMRVDVGGARDFAARLARTLKLGPSRFAVCLVDDDSIRELNRAFRNKPYATDVLSFAWADAEDGSARRQAAAPAVDREFGDYLGDVVISVETAQRNARGEGHSTGAEIRWLILHGLLHLLGMDHENDHGEMESLELSLRARLGLDGLKDAAGKPRGKRGNATKTPARRSPRASNNPRASNKRTRAASVRT